MGHAEHSEASRNGSSPQGASHSTDVLRRAHLPWTAGALQKAWAPTYKVASTNRRTASALVYSLLAAVAFVGAAALRFEFDIPAEQLSNMAVTVPVIVLLRLVSSYIFGISTGRWRYVGTNDVQRLVGAAGAATAVMYLLTWVFGILPVVPRSILIIDLLLFTWLTAGTWILYRTGFEQIRVLGGQQGTVR